MMTKQTFIDLFRQKAVGTVFTEMYDSWVAKHTTPEKAAAFEQMLKGPLTLEWLRTFAKKVSESAMRLLKSKEDPRYEYDPETNGERVRIVTAIMTTFMSVVSQVRGTLDVARIRTAKLTGSRLSEFLGTHNYDSSKRTPAISLADRSDMSIDDPANTVVVVGSNTPAGQDVLVDNLFRLNHRVLATVTVYDPADPVAFENSIRSHNPGLIVTRMNTGGGTILQARVIIKHRLPEYRLVKRIIGGYPFICFRRTEMVVETTPALASAA